MAYLAEKEGVAPLVLSGLGREISAFGDLRSFCSLRRIIREFRPHIIHTHTAKAGTLGRLAGLSRNVWRSGPERIRLVHTFHGHVFEGYFHPLKARMFMLIERVLAGFTDRIIVISRLQKRDICDRFRIVRPEKVAVIPLGFDLSAFSDSLPKDGRGAEESDHALRVGIIGRLTQVKNHRMLLKAVQGLETMGYGGRFRFFVVGDGELREDLAACARELGVEHLISFTGWKREMAPVYRTLDAVVLTSLNEGTPVTLIEAMASGIPVVATEVGGVPDLLGQVDKAPGEGYKLAQNGILVPSDRPESLAKALVFLLNHRQRSQEMAVRGKAFVLRRFSLDRLAGDIEALYRGLM
jgi:glycosyltransferase involved in cell wall biosynthesis